MFGLIKQVQIQQSTKAKAFNQGAQTDHLTVQQHADFRQSTAAIKFGVYKGYGLSGEANKSNS